MKFRHGIKFSLILLTLGCSPGKPIEGVHLVTELAEGVYVAEPKHGGGNSTIIINDDHVVVVDAQGTEAAAEALIEEIRRLSSDPVRFVINTHWHGDHHGGNRSLLRR